MKTWPLSLAIALGTAPLAVASVPPGEDPHGPVREAAIAAADEAQAQAGHREERAPTTIPPSFASCAAHFRHRTQPEGGRGPRFDCTSRYYDELDPQTTVDFAEAGNRALAVANLYIDSDLVPAVRRLAAPHEGPGSERIRGRLLDTYVAAARSAGLARCRVFADIWREGTIGVAVASGCGTWNRDRLIEDLIGIEDDLLPRG